MIKEYSTRAKGYITRAQGYITRARDISIMKSTLLDRHTIEERGKSLEKGI